MRFFGIESSARIIENSKNPTTGGANTYLVSPLLGWTKSSTRPRSQSASRRGLSAWGARFRRWAMPSRPVGATGSREARSASSGLYSISRISFQPFQACGSCGSGSAIWVASRRRTNARYSSLRWPRCPIRTSPKTAEPGFAFDSPVPTRYRPNGLVLQSSSRFWSPMLPAEPEKAGLAVFEAVAISCANGPAILKLCFFGGVHDGEFKQRKRNSRHDPGRAYHADPAQARLPLLGRGDFARPLRAREYARASARAGRRMRRRSDHDGRPLSTKRSRRDRDPAAAGGHDRP